MEELHQLIVYMLQLDEDIEEVDHEYDEILFEYFYPILLDIQLFDHLKNLNDLEDV